jgi:hypothetical protein
MLEYNNRPPNKLLFVYKINPVFYEYFGGVIAAAAAINILTSILFTDASALTAAWRLPVGVYGSLGLLVAGFNFIQIAERIKQQNKVVDEFKARERSFELEEFRVSLYRDQYKNLPSRLILASLLAVTGLIMIVLSSPLVASLSTGCH